VLISFGQSIATGLESTHLKNHHRAIVTSKWNVLPIPTNVVRTSLLVVISKRQTPMSCQSNNYHPPYYLLVMRLEASNKNARLHRSGSNKTTLPLPSNHHPLSLVLGRIDVRPLNVVIIITLTSQQTRRTLDESVRTF
jgi:hypothetical protein